MPKYFYKCSSCNELIEFYHSMTETKENCTLCNKELTLKKMPSFFTMNEDKNEDKDIGDLVKESIEDFRKELDEQKDKLKNEYFRKDK